MDNLWQNKKIFVKTTVYQIAIIKSFFSEYVNATYKNIIYLRIACESIVLEIIS